MSAPAKFGCWVAHDTDSVKGQLEYMELEPKAWEEDDIDVKVQYCGICASDVSLMGGELFEFPDPTVCGHEIVGEVVRVGSEVKDIKPGMTVGIGAQCDSCRECETCKKDDDQFCSQLVYTIGGTFSRGSAKGSTAQGGFAKYWRGRARFAIPIPDGVDPAVAGPLMCGGITVYSPLKQWGAGTERKNVGILGIGGLGHMGIMIAKAMGAEVTAISRGTGKRDDALKLGADKHISTGKDLGEDFKGHEESLDLIVCTINPPELPINDYLKLLKPRGVIALVGIVPKPLEVATYSLIVKGAAIAGSIVGSPDDLRDLLALAAKRNLKPWIQKYNMDDINKAIVAFGEGKPRYRFVLVNTDQGGKM